jgi:hypothetical protein
MLGTETSLAALILRKKFVISFKISRSLERIGKELGNINQKLSSNS